MKNASILYEYFCLLDAHNLDRLNDIQFTSFLKSLTPLNDDKIDKIFNMLDRQGKNFTKSMKHIII